MKSALLALCLPLALPAAARADEASDQALIDATVARLRARLPDPVPGLMFVRAPAEHEMSGSTFGWGPEDDRDYRYPETGLFPSPRHGIKVNLTTLAVEVMLLRERLPPLREALDEYILSELVHEVTHVRQYLRRPARALDCTPEGESRPGLRPCGELCPGGVCPEALTESTAQKAAYEREAMQAAFNAVNARILNNTEEGSRLRQAFAQADAYIQEHEAEYSEIAPTRPPALRNSSNRVTSWLLRFSERPRAVSETQERLFTSIADVPRQARIAILRPDSPEAIAARQALRDYHSRFNCGYGGAPGYLDRAYPYMSLNFRHALTDGERACPAP